MFSGSLGNNVAWINILGKSNQRLHLSSIIPKLASGSRMVLSFSKLYYSITDQILFMAQWTSNNLSCLNVWSILYVMRQHDEVFKKAGKIKMKNLLFFNPLLSDEELKFEAEGIADFLDKAFVNTCASEYEKNVDRDKAVRDMTKVLIDKNNTLADLAEKVDADYIF